MKYYISPSLLAADFTRLGDEVKKIERGGAAMLHLDVMDGTFVPNISFGLPVIESLRPISSLIFDVHLMITEPHRYIERFAEAGADIITFHYESNSDVASTIELIKKAGKRVSLSISPDTPAEAIFPYLSELDMVLVMTVYPGFGGQKLIPATLQKVKALRDYITEHSLSVNIEVDGGISPANVADVARAGANVIVAGSSVFHADDPTAAISAMLQGASNT
ncbi:MAG: ribulose-phosphate 3-epimerase [Clostridia bacterium]|nr:ribulose-phosphate 3-epimerase [Clostridia bacterium]